MITIPDFRQGDTVKWSTELSAEYQQGGWLLKWRFKGESELDVTATQSPPDLTFFSTISSNESNALIPGDYWWVAFVKKDSEKFTLADGRVKVSPNLYTVALPYDGRTTAEKQLDEVDQAISLIVNGAKASYKINDREFTYQTLPDLTRWRDKLRIEVKREKAREKVRQGLADPRIIHTRFRNYG